MKKIILLTFLALAFDMLSQELTEKNNVIENNQIFESIQVFPNPTSEILFIKNGELIDSYQLFSIQGELVQKGKSDAQIISLIDLPIGHYFLLLEIDGFYKKIRVSKF